MKKIYLDNSATTALDKKVINAMSKYWSKNFGNPSSIHSLGLEAKRVLQNNKAKLADILFAHEKEMTITSGGTESNNLAIFGLVNNLLSVGRKHSEIHLITTEIEHSSVLECFKKLELDGCKVDYLKVDQFGLINPKDLRDKIKPETALVSVSYANSEIGTIQPIKEIIKEIRHKRKEFGRERVGLPYFHIDASQAALYLNMNVEELGVDLMTIDAQKMYGPKGIGALYVRSGIKIKPIILGGGQEGNIRSGTENIPLIVGFVRAFELANIIKDKENKRLSKIRGYFFNSINKFVPNVIINGDQIHRLPNNINISIPQKDGEMMVLRLDEAGIISSSRSACSSGADESGVVRKIAEKTDETEEKIADRARSSLRFSMGKNTKIGDIKKLLHILKNIK